MNERKREAKSDMIYIINNQELHTVYREMNIPMRELNKETEGNY